MPSPVLMGKPSITISDVSKNSQGRHFPKTQVSHKKQESCEQPNSCGIATHEHTAAQAAGHAHTHTIARVKRGGKDFNRARRRGFLPAGMRSSTHARTPASPSMQGPKISSQEDVPHRPKKMSRTSPSPRSIQDLSRIPV